jgi:hypothetical protein
VFIARRASHARNPIDIESWRRAHGGGGGARPDRNSACHIAVARGASPANNLPPARHVGWFDAVGNRETEDINQDVALSSFHSLVPIEATNAALFSCLYRLAVHDDDCGIWLSTRCQASQRIECTVQQRPNTRHTPASDVAVCGRPGREVVGKLTPLATGAEQIDDRVEDGAEVRCTRTTAELML